MFEGDKEGLGSFLVVKINPKIKAPKIALTTKKEPNTRRAQGVSLSHSEELTEETNWGFKE